MHKKPLTSIEETGLIVHGFGRHIGKPSQAADIFRSGVAWGLTSIPDMINDMKQLLDHGMPFDDDLRSRLADLLTEINAAQAAKVSA